MVHVDNDVKNRIGDAFQQETKYQRGLLPGGYPDFSSKPGTYKQYPSAPKVRLPPPEHESEASLWEIIGRRRSVRDFKNKSITKSELSQLLWAAQGISDKEFGFRTAPSAGALYPVETYLVVNFVEDIDPGIYHYSVETHELDLLMSGDFRIRIAHSALDQGIAYRYVYLDAGHIAQNVALAAVAMNLGSCQVGALYDDEANDLLGVDGTEESVIYMTVIGKR